MHEGKETQQSVVVAIEENLPCLAHAIILPHHSHFPLRQTSFHNQ